MATPRGADEPLSVLVARVLVPLVWQLDDERPGSLAMWADLLRVVPEGGASERDLGALAHVSPRSMHVLLTGAERMGFVNTEKAPKGGNFVRRTAAGDDECRTLEARVAEVESRWRRDHGILIVEDGIARLTPKGVRLRDRHRPTIDAVEQELAEKVGEKQVVSASKALVKVARNLRSAHVRHLSMDYRPGPKWIEASPRAL